MWWLNGKCGGSFNFFKSKSTKQAYAICNACICTEQQKADDTMACGAKTTLRQKVTEWPGKVWMAPNGGSSLGEGGGGLRGDVGRRRGRAPGRHGEDDDVDEDKSEGGENHGPGG